MLLTARNINHFKRSADHNYHLIDPNTKQFNSFNVRLYASVLELKIEMIVACVRYNIPLLSYIIRKVLQCQYKAGLSCIPIWFEFDI